MVPIDRSPRSIPTPHEIGAARIVMSIIGHGDRLDALRASYERYVSNGVYCSYDLESAERCLVAWGFLSSSDDCLLPTPQGRGLASLDDHELVEAVVLNLLVNSPPLWLSAAVSNDGVVTDYMPTEALACFEELGFDPDERDALLAAAGQKFDGGTTSAIGLAGELCVVVSCRVALIGAGRPDLADAVWHVSLISDAHGYDVRSPHASGGTSRLEVKTASTAGEIFHPIVTRNEVSYGLSDPTWALVVCRHVDGQASVVGWCSIETFVDRLPSDSASGGRWKTAQVTLTVDDLTPGLPVIGGA